MSVIFIDRPESSGTHRKLTTQPPPMRSKSHPIIDALRNDATSLVALVCLIAVTVWMFLR